MKNAFERDLKGVKQMCNGCCKLDKSKCTRIGGCWMQKGSGEY